MSKLLRLVGLLATLAALLLLLQLSLASSFSWPSEAGTSHAIQVPAPMRPGFTPVLPGGVPGSRPALDASALHVPLSGAEEITATLSLIQASVLSGQQVTIPLTLTLPQGQVYGADVVLTYEPAVVSATEVLPGELATGWSMASNTTTPGVVRAGMASATPILGGGELLLFVFEAVGSPGSESELTLTRGDLNEGDIPTELEHGQLCVAIPVQPDFLASPTSGVEPLTVVFTNTSTGDYTTTLWDFGDSVTSTLDSPTHTYATTGLYTVTLTASGPGGTDVVTRPSYISVWLAHDIELSTGWNAVSWPLAPVTKNLTDTLASCSACDGAWSYDAWDEADPWKRWPDELIDVDETMGLWLHATEPVTLTLTGLQPISPTIELRGGWNLAGYPAQSERPVAEALSSIECLYTRVTTWDARDPVDPWKQYDADAPAYANDLLMMEPGRGYWIYVTTTCTLSIAP